MPRKTFTDKEIERVAKRLKERRDELGLTQGQMAERLGGYSQGRVSRVERGEDRPGVPFVEALARDIGISSDELIGRSGTGSEPSRPAPAVDLRAALLSPEFKAAVAEAVRAALPPQPTPSPAKPKSTVRVRKDG